MINITVKDFLTVIEQQKKLYAELKNVLLAENRMLVSGETGAMEDLIKREESLAISIMELESGKKSVMNRLAIEAGFKDNSGAGLKQILDVSGDTGGEITKAVEELITIVSEVEGLNRSNRHMITNFVDYAEFARVAGEKYGAQNGETYSQDGKTGKEPVPKARIDRTI
ncbi:MAG: flagellar protein FlgN [Spirochaetia bacterium]|nr:flagellar protein FlgN [Spirochaetia bacterium]